MGRVNEAMRRAQQLGVATEFEPIAARGYDASALATEPFPAEAGPEPVIAEPPQAAAQASPDDTEIQEIFFNTYPEKVWGRQDEIDRLDNLLTKVKRQSR